MVLEEALLWLERLSDIGDATAWRWQTRVAAAAAVMAAIGSAQQHLPEQLLNQGAQLVCHLLSDEAYLARVQGARLVPTLLQTSLQMQVSGIVNMIQMRCQDCNHLT